MHTTSNRPNKISFNSSKQIPSAGKHPPMKLCLSHTAGHLILFYMGEREGEEWRILDNLERRAKLIFRRYLILIKLKKIHENIFVQTENVKYILHQNVSSSNIQYLHFCV